MKKLFFALTILASALVFQSCDKDNDVIDIPPGLQAPEIPSAVLYTIPTYEIAQDSVAGGEDILTRGAFSRDNWIHAGLSLFVWNSIVVVNLALPVSAIAEAFNHDWVYIGNNTFAWTYQHTADPMLGGATYNIVLTGQYISNDEVEWILTASQVGGFQSFEWVKAVVATDHTEAEFTIYRNPGNAEQYLRINSTYQPFDQVASVRLTNVIAGDPGNGHFIEYGADNNIEHNRSFHVFGGAGNTMDIEWNEPQRFGRVMHLAHFGDAEWHCWDANYFDVDCN